MAILETEVWVGLNSVTIKHYESLGYEIPKYKSKNNGMSVKKGTKLLVKVIDLPKSSTKKLTKQCDDCGEIIKNQSYYVILKQREKGDGKDRCKKCGIAHSWINKKDNVTYEKSLEYWAKTNNKECLLDEFSDKNERPPSKISYGTHDEYWWNCFDCKSEYSMSVTQRTNSDNDCPYCAGQRVNETNCLWSMLPDVAKLLFESENGYKYTSHSNKKVDWKCPDCNNKIKSKPINRIADRGLSCPRCSDGISYPEKFMYNVLNQLNIEFETQKIFNWSEGKRYDFYIPSLNCIIETHGDQHYGSNFKRSESRTLEEEQRNDKLKKKLATINKIESYIVVDCSKSEFSYIKESVLNSEVSILMDLTTINWLECHKMSCNSFVKEASDLWKKGIKDTSKISNMLKISRITVTRYLKKGSSLGMCDYNSKEVMQEVRRLSGKKNGKQIIQLTIDGEFIKVWSSMTEASKELKIHCTSISEVCNGYRKNAGNFKWMHKKDYESYKETQDNAI